MERMNQLPPPPRSIRPYSGDHTRSIFWGENLMACGVAAVGIVLFIAVVCGIFTGWNERVGGNAIAFYYAILANLVFTPTYYLIWVKRSRERQLYVQGAEAEGIITEKRKYESEVDSFLIDYTFTDMRGQHRNNCVKVEKDQWQAAATGDKLIVLYSPGNSKRSVPYLYGRYEIDAVRKS